MRLYASDLFRMRGTGEGLAAIRSRKTKGIDKTLSSMRTDARAGGQLKMGDRGSQERLGPTAAGAREGAAAKGTTARSR
jgi:hypothetical protein